MTVINLDLDGVIYDFEGTFRAFLLEKYDLSLDVSENWDMHVSWGMSKSWFYKTFQEAIEWGVFNRGEPVEFGVEAVNALATNGRRVRIVTAKKFPLPRLTHIAQVDVLAWLKRYDLLHRVELCFTNDKRGYAADIVVDDKPTLSWAQPLARNILFDQPWNKNTELPEGPMVISRGGWEEVLGTVEALEYEGS